MVVDQTFNRRNLRYSFNAFVKTHLATAHSISVNYGNREFATEALTKWITIYWGPDTMTKQGRIPVQLTMVTREDPMRTELNNLQNIVLGVFDLNNDTRITFNAYDASVPPVGTDTGKKMLVRVGSLIDQPVQSDNLIEESTLELKLLFGRKARA